LGEGRPRGGGRKGSFLYRGESPLLREEGGDSSGAMLGGRGKTALLFSKRKASAGGEVDSYFQSHRKVTLLLFPRKTLMGGGGKPLLFSGE